MDDNLDDQIRRSPARLSGDGSRDRSQRGRARRGGGRGGGGGRGRGRGHGRGANSVNHLLEREAVKKAHSHSGRRRDPLGGRGRGRNGSRNPKDQEADASLNGTSGEFSTEAVQETNAALENWLPSIVASNGIGEVSSEGPVEQKTHAELESWLSQWQPTEKEKSGQNGMANRSPVNASSNSQMSNNEEKRRGNKQEKESTGNDSVIGKKQEKKSSGSASGGSKKSEKKSSGASGELSTEAVQETNAALENWLPSIVASNGPEEVSSEGPVEQKTHAELESWLSQWQPTEKEKSGQNGMANRSPVNASSNSQMSNNVKPVLEGKKEKQRGKKQEKKSTGNDSVIGKKQEKKSSGSVSGGSKKSEKKSIADSTAGGKKLEKKSSDDEFVSFPSYWSYSDCLALYAAKDSLVIRGKLRVLSGNDGKAFVTCDRGSFQRDVLIATPLEQNRALDCDSVFVELYPEEEVGGMQKMNSKLEEMNIQNEVKTEPVRTWQDDRVQRQLWDPVVVISKPPNRPKQLTPEHSQRKGRVVHVIFPTESAGMQPSELKPTNQSHLQKAPQRTIVGRLNRMRSKRVNRTRRNKNGDVIFLTPNNKSLPQFICPDDFQVSASDDKLGEILFKADYVYGSWKEDQKKPLCFNVQKMGMSCNVEDETLALLLENNVNHGDFTAPVLKDVDAAVESGMELQSTQEMGWRPTPEMYAGRRDYRSERIFTIDPTTAKDLDDALHVKALPDGRVEIGVHIADVSHFVQPGTAVDEEALRRATTVYLVDRTVPMLPRPLCEIACSLNENMERLAFSCVWRMNMDGTVESPNKKSGDEVWYGRTVIKSCARLDYATAQNIIEAKVATGEASGDIDESLWPASRRPSGRHTIDQVAADVRLMNRVAQARRRLRFQNGAIALNGIKLAFQLDSDGETPMLCAPYPLRDSNRLVEEFMLLANYFVAQRLITHAGGLALLRHHPPPLMDGIEKAVDVAKQGIGFDIDATSSSTLQASLSRLGRECGDELVIQCVTQMLMVPMKPAEYMAAGGMEREEWRHFALNIPYYTHFTSPIRRYPDVIVHRLLQATLDGEKAIQAFPMDESEVQSVSNHCNEKRMASKKAQDRSDRVFLALYLRKEPLKSQLGVVLSVGEKTFNVFVPSLGASVMLFLDEHKEQLTFEPYISGEDERRIRLVRKTDVGFTNGNSQWTSIDVKVFTKLLVSCHCKDKPPIDVKVKLEGPWTSE